MYLSLYIYISLIYIYIYMYIYIYICRATMALAADPARTSPARDLPAPNWSHMRWMCFDMREQIMKNYGVALFPWPGSGPVQTKSLEEW